MTQSYLLHAIIERDDSSEVNDIICIISPDPAAPHQWMADAHLRLAEDTDDGRTYRTTLKVIEPDMARQQATDWARQLIADRLSCPPGQVHLLSNWVPYNLTDNEP